MLRVVLKWLGIFILASLIIMQFFRIDKTNPPVDAKLDFVSVVQPPQQISAMLKSACYDCHSNETVYPWYSNIAPVSWWLKDHVEHGRHHLNFSEWNNYSQEEKQEIFEEAIEEVEEAEMPLKGYAAIHSKANLNTEQRAELVKWLKAGMRYSNL